MGANLLVEIFRLFFFHNLSYRQQTLEPRFISQDAFASLYIRQSGNDAPLVEIELRSREFELISIDNLRTHSFSVSHHLSCVKFSKVFLWKRISDEFNADLVRENIGTFRDEFLFKSQGLTCLIERYYRHI